MAECPYPIQNDPTKLKPVMQQASYLLHTKYKFRTVECLRTQERQDWMLAHGKSKVKHSAHQDGLAMDIYPLEHGYDTSDEELDKIYALWADICETLGHKAHPQISWDKLHLQLDLKK